MRALTAQEQQTLDQILNFAAPAGTPMSSIEDAAAALSAAAPGWQNVVELRESWAPLARLPLAADGRINYRVWRALIEEAGGGLALRLLETLRSKSVYEGPRGKACTLWLHRHGLRPGNDLWHGHPVDHTLELLSRRWIGRVGPTLIYKLAVLGGCGQYGMPETEDIRTAMQDLLPRLLAPFAEAGYLTDLERLEPCDDKLAGQPTLPRIGYVLHDLDRYRDPEPEPEPAPEPEGEPGPEHRPAGESDAEGAGSSASGRFDIERVLAIYRPSTEEIIVCAPKIISCANSLKVHPATLLPVVLVHELGHWLMHRLRDGRDQVWDTRSYYDAHTYVHEGWAQLMTAWMANELGGEFQRCFEELAKHQSYPYQVFRNYVGYPRELVVRSLAFMREGPTPCGLAEWDAALALAKP